MGKMDIKQADNEFKYYSAFFLLLWQPYLKKDKIWSDKGCFCELLITSPVEKVAVQL